MRTPPIRPMPSNSRLGALLEALFAKYPDHPGLAHYIIHAYDEPALASRAKEAADRYGIIAPSTPHALHMPSHTFTRIGDWQASIDTNAASAAAAQAAHQPADLLHASDYMVYAYLQTAQDKSAKQLVDSSAKVFTDFDPAHATGAAPASAAYYAHADIPARYFLERQAWADAAGLKPLASPIPYANAITYFARGLGAAHGKDKPAVQQAIDSLREIWNELAKRKEDYWANQIDIERQELVALPTFMDGHEAEALAGMRHAVEMEDKTEKAAVSPGPLKPAREMLGELLLELNCPSEALTEFQTTLDKEPNRFRSLYGAAQAAKRARERETMDSYFQKLIVVARRADQPGRPELAEARAAIAND